jgi:hypothetical protein
MDDDDELGTADVTGSSGGGPAGEELRACS